MLISATQAAHINAFRVAYRVAWHLDDKDSALAFVSTLRQIWRDLERGLASYEDTIRDACTTLHALAFELGRETNENVLEVAHHGAAELRTALVALGGF